MFSEILKIVPKLDKKELDNMEKSLSKRFTRVAKKFGQGMGSIFKGGALLGLGLAFVNKILNPLKEVQAAIDSTLTKNDDLVTAAGQFETSAGKLIKLNTLARASGLAQQDLLYLLTKFQGSLAAQKRGTEDNGLAQFTEYTDIGDAFFDFIQSLQKMSKSDQVLVQERVFGERQIMKMSDFLQQDFKKLTKLVGNDKYTSSELSAASVKISNLSDLKDALFARNEQEDIINKSRSLNEGVIRQMAEGDKLRLQRENQRIQNYNSLKAIDNTTQKMAILLESGVTGLGKFINMITPKINQLIEAISSLKNSKLFRLWGGK